MTWFGWIYVVVIAGCCGVIGFCAWDILRIARHMKRQQERDR